MPTDTGTASSSQLETSLDDRLKNARVGELDALCTTVRTEGMFDNGFDNSFDNSFNNSTA
jgi:hypothetical protein